MVILIDNGHGINTKGKQSVDGSLKEWKYARDIAYDVSLKLKAMGYNAMRIVTEDNDVSLAERVYRVNTICKEVGASNVLLVSIHCNAAR